MQISNPPNIPSPIDANVTQWRGVAPLALNNQNVAVNVREWIGGGVPFISTMQTKQVAPTGYETLPNLGYVSPVSSGSADTYGAWVQVVASSARPFRIAFLTVSHRIVGGGVPGYVQVDVAFGASAAEVSMAVLGAVYDIDSAASDTPPVILALPVISDVISVGTRIAIRIADGVAANRTYDAQLGVIWDTKLEALV